MIRTTTPLNHINMLSRQIHAPVALLLLLLCFSMNTFCTCYARALCLYLTAVVLRFLTTAELLRVHEVHMCIISLSRNVICQQIQLSKTDQSIQHHNCQITSKQSQSFGKIGLLLDEAVENLTTSSQ